MVSSVSTGSDILAGELVNDQHLMVSSVSTDDSSKLFDHRSFMINTLWYQVSVQAKNSLSTA